MRRQSLGERPPFGGRQPPPEMRQGDVMPVDRRMRRPATGRIDAVRDDLMPVKVEVDPVGGAASFGAAEDRAVKMARGVEVINREGDVERGEAGHFPSLPHMHRECQRGTWAEPLNMLGARPRSEEHTSELQSLMRISYAVFCLKK